MNDNKQIVSKMARRFNKVLRSSYKSRVTEELYKEFKQIVWDTIFLMEQKACEEEVKKERKKIIKFLQGYGKQLDQKQHHFMAFGVEDAVTALRIKLKSDDKNGK